MDELQKEFLNKWVKKLSSIDMRLWGLSQVFEVDGTELLDGCFLKSMGLIMADISILVQRVYEDIEEVESRGWQNYRNAEERGV